MKKNGTQHDTARPSDPGRPAGGKEELVPLQQAVQRHEEPLAPDLTPGEQRAERVRRLKEQVSNGTYNPDLRRTAQILLYDDTDALLGR